MKKWIYLLFLVFGSTSLFAQERTDGLLSFSNKDQESYVVKDPRIDLLIQQQIYINKLSLRNVSGYRLQVINTTDRSAANSAKAKIMKLYPDQKTYLTYQSPYFQVRVGNFFKKDSANAMRSKLNPLFPDGVLVVREKVEIDPDALLEQLKARDEDLD